jgi:hypothetical protein
MAWDIIALKDKATVTGDSRRHQYQVKIDVFGLCDEFLAAILTGYMCKPPSICVNVRSIHHDSAL